MKSKKELRALCKERRKAINGKAEKSADIARKILTMSEVKKADALFLFYPLEGEINLLPIAEYAWREGKSVGFPLCEDKDGSMTFRLVNSLSELKEKSFGIKEPSTDAPEIFPKNTVIFLPALAIDKQGYRLGYGKGYYDRYLAKHAELKSFTVGVVYKDLLLDELPHNGYDVACDTVVCEE